MLVVEQRVLNNDRDGDEDRSKAMRRAKAAEQRTAAARQRRVFRKWYGRMFAEHTALCLCVTGGIGMCFYKETTVLVAALSENSCCLPWHQMNTIDSS